MLKELCFMLCTRRNVRLKLRVMATLFVTAQNIFHVCELKITNSLLHGYRKSIKIRDRFALFCACCICCTDFQNTPGTRPGCNIVRKRLTH